jgi:hypothetical protein
MCVYIYAHVHANTYMHVFMHGNILSLSRKQMHKCMCMHMSAHAHTKWSMHLCKTHHLFAVILARIKTSFTVSCYYSINQNNLTLTHLCKLLCSLHIANLATDIMSLDDAQKPNFRSPFHITPPKWLVESSAHHLFHCLISHFCDKILDYHHYITRFNFQNIVMHTVQKCTMSCTRGIQK